MVVGSCPGTIIEHLALCHLYKSILHHGSIGGQFAQFFVQSCNGACHEIFGPPHEADSRTVNFRHIQSPPLSACARKPTIFTRRLMHQSERCEKSTPTVTAMMKNLWRTVKAVGGGFTRVANRFQMSHF